MTGIAGRLGRTVDRMREHDWIVPFGMVLLSIGLALSIEALDDAVQGHIAQVWWLFSGGEKVAQQLLTAIAAAMVAIITMVFSNIVTTLTFIAHITVPRCCAASCAISRRRSSWASSLGHSSMPC